MEAKGAYRTGVEGVDRIGLSVGGNDVVEDMGTRWTAK